MALHFFLHKYV